MKNKKLFAAIAVIAICSVAFTACGGNGDSTENSAPDSGSSSVASSSDAPESVSYGLPQAAVGHYIKDADIFDDGETRYIVYTTNGESGEEDNAIGVRSAAYGEEKKDWAYGDETIVLEGEENKWDAYIGSASVVKGAYRLNGVSYNWLMAYCATDKTNDTHYQIGFALAQDIAGTWTKAASMPFIAFDGTIYGSSSVGCYAPSLINLNKESKIRVFYTYADTYGHFARFVDIDAADVGAIYSEEAKTDVDLVSGTVQVPTNGNLSGGDAAMMFPNSDFAYDAEKDKFFAVKDYSPSAALNPNYAERIEIASIAEEELYTAEILDGWKSIKVWTMLDTEEQYERIYSGCIVSDAYGQVNGEDCLEVVYNHCEIEADNANWMFTQNLAAFKVNISA